ncbi:hypothetical protein [Ottowia sp.]|uniref:hypothetical protein n=1 Tax=Ottowia sp. TaxID=1898956 RepID=UPI0025D0785A|nr:hypothetical protein [Ottowia sp.]MBK6616758.1 hypothetical protein [Ottowia sp.]
MPIWRRLRPGPDAAEIVTRPADATAKVTADKAVAASLEAQGPQALVLREQARGSRCRRGARDLETG